MARGARRNRRPWGRPLRQLRLGLIGLACLGGGILLVGCGRGGSEPAGGGAPTAAIPAAGGGEGAEDADVGTLGGSGGGRPEAAVLGTLIVPLGPGAEPTPKPAPPMWRATERGCCPLPFWSADSKSVQFWFAPAEAPAGVYRVPVEGADPAFVGDRPAAIFARGAFTSTRAGETTTLWRNEDGRRWDFELGPDGWLAVAPDGRRLATVRQLGRFIPGQRPPATRYGLVDLATGATNEVQAPAGYALAGWTADGVWLMTLTENLPDRPGLIRFDPRSAQVATPGAGDAAAEAGGVDPAGADSGGTTGATSAASSGAAGADPTAGASGPSASATEAHTDTLSTGNTGLVPLTDPTAAWLGQLRAAKLSPGGRWIAFMRAFDPNPAANGVFVVSTRFDSPPRRLDPRLVGGYAWRDANRLLVIPQEPGRDGMGLWQIDVSARYTERLIDPLDAEARPFRVAGGEWSVSPDGHHLAYRHASDDSIWVVLLP